MPNLHAVALHAQEAAVNPNVPNHWLVGGLALAILLVVLIGLLIFGAGREHS